MKNLELPGKPGEFAGMPVSSWKELEPYSFEPMRESSGSEEEEGTEREDSRRGNGDLVQL